MTFEEIQDLIRAERLWWSEASERQVKRLEVEVDTQINQAFDRLHDLNRQLQERVVEKLEEERKERNAAFSAMRRDIDNQQVLVTEAARHKSANGAQEDL